VKILFLPKGGRKTGSSRVRIYNHVDRLKDNQNVEVRVIPFRYEVPIDVPRWIYDKSIELLESVSTLPQAVKWADIIVVQRVLSPLFNRILMISNAPVVFDLDDALYATTNSTPGRYQRDIDSKLKNIFKNIDAIIAGNSTVGEYALQFNDNVFVLPTAVNVQEFSPAKSTPDDDSNVTVGWVGNGPSHIENLRILPENIKSAEEYDITFRIIGTQGDPEIESMFDSVPDSKIELIDWIPSQKIPKEVRRFDIGLMPLVDDNFQRGKCSLKSLEYMASGVTPVASAVGMNRDVIDDGKNGRLVHDPSMWEPILSQLIEDTDLRKEMGAEARKTAVRSYALEVVNKRMIKILNEVLRDA